MSYKRTSSFDSFDKKFNWFNRLFIIAFCSISAIILLAVCSHIGFVGYFKYKNGEAYSVSITSYNSSNNYAASQIISQTDRCVTFKNWLGNVETECGSFVSVTKY